MDVIQALSNDGYVRLGNVVAPEMAATVLSRIRADRSIDSGLFLTQAVYEANPEHKGVNPFPGRNYAESCADILDDLQSNPEITTPLSEVLGNDYEILDRKFVVGVPQAQIPPWVLAKVKGNGVNNLGAYIKPQYRDITYFWGIDLHQDIIDWKDREADFITMYVYLDDVGPKDAPLYILPKSHKFGATIFPHDLEIIDKKTGAVTYRGQEGQELNGETEMLLGGAGSVNIWHSCLLHGTQPTANDVERISLRYLIARGTSRNTVGIDQVNETIDGPTSLSILRQDLNKDGTAGLKGNKINQI